MVRGLKLSRNFGHQNALLAGLLKAKGQADCVISIDADLQQDEGAIPEFIDKYNEGFDIVFGVREDRRSDGVAKKATALVFYRLMNLMGVRIIRNHADYRLVSNRVLETLAGYGEVNLFLRGIFPSLGFRSAQVVHDVRERFAGESKYSMRKMLSFALDGITSFSVMPMRVVALVGVLIFFFSLGMSGYVLLAKLLGGAVTGWASTVLPIYFIGGIQLISLGVIGEYVGKIYMEAKRRPRFIVEEEV
jgi:glycosyltransferase involved in cell wall biosynthesis